MIQEGFLAITKSKLVFGALLVAFAGSLYGAIHYYGASTQKDLENQSLIHDLGELNEQLTAANIQNEDLKTLLASRVEQLQLYTGQIQGLSSAVSQLDKLTKTDKELLAKYSAVYFLNENYTPVSLSPVESIYLARPSSPQEVLTGIKGHVDALLSAAKAAGNPLTVVSSYRSFTEQKSLKSGYKVTYGAGTANSFSADQGYSEHQLGTTIDFSTPALNAVLTGFDKTQAFAWLNAHAHEYGFILSYPKGNGYFVYEPWHWRYVGVELATKLHTQGLRFYELDQREIDKYLLKFFD